MTFRFLLDQILAAIQRRCEHPEQFVAVDILEGCSSDTEVAYCRRCGAVKVNYKRLDGTLFNAGWRLPDPNLWRNRKWRAS